MPTDLTVVLADEPGELARLGEVTLSAGVHLRGLAAFTGDGRGFVHALVDDGDVATAKQALKAARMKVADTREVLVAELGPGGLIDVMLALAEAERECRPGLHGAGWLEGRDRHRRRAQRARRAHVVRCRPVEGLADDVVETLVGARA